MTGLRVRWRITTPQKERWADAIEAWAARLDADDPPIEGFRADRWWRTGDEGRVSQ